MYPEDPMDSFVTKGELIMIKIIAGEKGTGKTARLVEDINNVATTDNHKHTHEHINIKNYRKKQKAI